MEKRSPLSIRKNYLNRFPGSPKVYPLCFEKMVVVSIDNFSNDDLARKYGELVNKETWDEICKNCRIPTLLHEGVCTRQNEAAALEHDKILDERDKFGERMRPILRYMAEQEEKVNQENEQNALVRELKNLVGTMKAKENKTAKIVNPARVPV